MSGKPCVCARCGAEGRLNWVDGHSHRVKPPDFWVERNIDGHKRFCDTCAPAVIEVERKALDAMRELLLPSRYSDAARLLHGRQALGDNDE